MKTIPQQVGYRIRKLREQKDFIQLDIATKLKITPGAYAKIERGETDPSITRLHQIATILKVDVINLIQDSEGTADVSNLNIQMGAMMKQLGSMKKEMETIKKSKSAKK